MASDLCSVTIVGRLTRDAEQRQAGETSIQSMRLAFSTRKKTGGEWGDVSGYVDVVLFGREGLAPYLVKGTRIGVSGRLAWREWEKDGVKRQAIEVVANDVQLLDSKGDAKLREYPAPVDDTDIPF